MAGAGVYQRNGFEVVDEAGRFQLLAYRLSGEDIPAIRREALELSKPDGHRPKPDSDLPKPDSDLPKPFAAYGEGLHLVYSPQCPMLPKSVNDLREMAAEYGLQLQVTELQSAQQAQAAPSLYGVYALLWNGKLLADHYVSKGRFKGLLRDMGIESR